MANFVPDIIICSFIVITLVAAHLIANFIRIRLGGNESDLPLTQIIEAHTKEFSWLIKLCVNCFGYSCVFIPGLLIHKYVKVSNYIEKSDKTFIHKAVASCINGSTTSAEFDDRIDPQQKNSKPLSRSVAKDFMLIIYCTIGLMTSYLTWGVLQEKIMTQEYTNFDGKKTYFKDSQFLVFVNRLLGFFIAVVYISLQKSMRHKAPLYKYSFASFSNILSAWFQYEALKFVNFPTQVLAKSSKIIPVMLMGKIISRTKYEFYEYVVAFLITTGMIFFLTGSADESRASHVTTILGYFLLAMYMIFDAFTTNWQGDLLKTYSMSPVQMMCGVNLFSTFFTAASLSLQGGFFSSLEFATEHPKFMFDCIVLSISSAIGQLFIYYTISVFGPVVFTIIMTCRQALAIMLSCFLYNHSISSLGIIGVIIVFAAIFLRSYCSSRLRSRKRSETNRTTKMTV